MRILPAALILHEILWFFQFSDVVIISSDAGIYGIGPDARGRGLSQVTQDDRVMVGAGSLELKTLQERMIVVAQYEKAHVGACPERHFKHEDDGH